MASVNASELDRPRHPLSAGAVGSESRVGHVTSETSPETTVPVSREPDRCEKNVDKSKDRVLETSLGRNKTLKETPEGVHEDTSKKKTPFYPWNFCKQK